MSNIINKVIYDGRTLIDLTSDTAEADKVLAGYTFHAKSGAVTEGNCTFDADTSDANASASEILKTKTAYVAGAKVTGSMENRGSQTSTIATKAQNVTISQGYHDGGGKVSIDSTEQAKIIASNIKNGVQILGVTGSYAGEEQPTQSKTFTPTSEGSTIIPDSGYLLSQVVVNPVPYTETVNASGGYTATIL